MPADGINPLPGIERAVQQSQENEGRPRHQGEKIPEGHPLQQADPSQDEKNNEENIGQRKGGFERPIDFFQAGVAERNQVHGEERGPKGHESEGDDELHGGDSLYRFPGYGFS